MGLHSISPTRASVPADSLTVAKIATQANLTGLSRILSGPSARDPLTLQWVAQRLQRLGQSNRCVKQP